MLIQRWRKELPLERVKFEDLYIWVHIRELPLEAISTHNICQLTSKIGEVIQVDYQDSTLPKWYPILGVLVFFFL